MKLPIGRWTPLPRLGSDAFRELMKAGVEYSTGKGFLFKQGSDLPAARRIVEAATSQKVEFLFECYLCGRETSCSDCEYSRVCSIEIVGGRCICLSCAAKPLATYVRRWSEGSGLPGD